MLNSRSSVTGLWGDLHDLMILKERSAQMESSFKLDKGEPEVNVHCVFSVYIFQDSSFSMH